MNEVREVLRSRFFGRAVAASVNFLTHSRRNPGLSLAVLARPVCSCADNEDTGITKLKAQFDSATEGRRGVWVCVDSPSTGDDAGGVDVKDATRGDPDSELNNTHKRHHT